jgi:hypothetical protein
MSSILSTVGGLFEEPPRPSEKEAAAAARLSGLVESASYVGEVFSLGYNEALVQIHDHHRGLVGGIPALSFLLATRLPVSPTPDIWREDFSVVLLRVLDQADLPNSQEALRVRVETAQRVSGNLDRNWDDRTIMDPTTHQLLSYAGVRCRVLGTYYIDEAQGRLALHFGSDLSNYYPNRGLKVFKPRGDVLSAIVNYRDPRRHDDEVSQVEIGRVRYASTNRPHQNTSSIRVSITPTDLLKQKTALFGMTRMGKSNTTKTVLKSLFELRWAPTPMRVGQLVLRV